MEIYNEEKFKKGGVILERIHPDLDVKPYVPYYEKMGYVVSIVEKPNGWVELIGEKKDTFEDAYGRFKNDIRKNTSPRKMAKGGVTASSDMKPLNEFLNEKKKSVDLKAVASYYGMSWFQFSSLSNKKIKEYKEMYIKHQEMNEGGKFADGGRIVGNYYYDTRFDKPFRVLSEDGDKIGLEYIDKKNQSTELKTVKRNEFDYNVKMGAWNKYTQPFTYADGGEVSRYKTGITKFGKNQYAVRVDVGDKNLIPRLLNGKYDSKSEAEAFAKRLAKRNNGTYVGEDGNFADGGMVLMEISTHKAVRNGDKIDIISKGIEIDDLKFNDEKLYSIPYENIDDLLPIFDGLEENNRINLYGYKKGGKIKELQTDEFTYYVDEDGENVEMYRNSDNSLVSDNYFAENDLYERMQEIANGREKYVYINPDSLEYLDEYKYGKGGKLPRKKGLGWKRDRERISQEPHEQAYKSKRKGKYSSFDKGGEIDDTILVKPRHASREDIKDLYDEVEENMYEYKTFKAPNNEADYISITPDNFSERNRITEYLDNESWEYEEYARGGRTKIENDGVDFNEEMYKGILGDKDKDGTENADDLEPSNPNVSKNIEGTKFTDTFRTLLGDKRTYDDSMYSIIGEMEKILPQKFDIIARTKTPFSILKKLVEKRLKFKRNKEGKVTNKGLTDVVGTTIATNNTKELMTLRKMIGVDDGDNGIFGEVIEVDDKFKIPACGYRAIHYIVLYNGVPVEIQLKTKRMKMLNEFTHPFYKAGDLDCDGMGELAEIVVMADNGSKEAQKEFTDIFEDKDLLRSMVSKSYAKGGEVKVGEEVDRNGKKFIITEVENKPSGYGKFYHAYLKGDTSKKIRFDGLDINKMDKGGEVEWFDYSKIDLEPLPYDLDRYFIKDADTKEIDLNLLEPTRAREKGVKNANKYMRMAYDGEIDRRKPISVYERNGEMFVFDGNSTIANAKNSGWKTIYVEMIDDPMDDFEKGGRTEDAQTLREMSSALRKGSGMHEKQSEQLIGASSSHKKQAKNLDRIADKISKGYAKGGKTHTMPDGSTMLNSEHYKEGGEVENFIISKGFKYPQEVYFEADGEFLEVIQADNGKGNVGIFYVTEEIESISRKMLRKIASEFGNRFDITLFTNAGVDLHSKEKGKYKNITVKRIPYMYAKGGKTVLNQKSKNPRKKNYFQFSIVKWDETGNKLLENHKMLVQRATLSSAREVVRRKYPKREGYFDELDKSWTK